MSITSEELNYLIWRYLQESGKEVSALALQEESRVLEFEEKFGEHIPVGTLVNFIQKGILYTESELMVRYDGEVTPVDKEHCLKDFTLVQALEVDRERYPEIAPEGRFALESEVKPEDKDDKRTEPAPSATGENSNFIKTLQEKLKFPMSSNSQWNPQENSLIALGGQDSAVKIAKLAMDSQDWKILELFSCQHPPALSATADTTTNSVTCLQWSPSGQSLLSGVENGELRLWSKDGKLQNILNLHRSPIITLKWNQDGTHILSGDLDNVVIVWNAGTGTPLQHFEIKEPDSVETLGVVVEWIGLDKFVIPGPQGAILVCEMGKNRPLGKLIGHTKTLTEFEYNASNNMLLSASDDLTVRVWRSGSINSLNCFYGHSQSITSAFWINDDNIITSSIDGSVRVYSHSLHTLMALSMVDGVPIFCGSISPDKKKFAIGKQDGGVTIYDIEKLIKVLDAVRSLQEPIPIPIMGDYQYDGDHNSVAAISWCYDSNQLSISYSLDDTTAISLG
ncbi:LAFE_0D08702g1_1 [Lachancea fermentati]|uniref:LAFE_0D08702g1_1 n=1 Tax=Lachancea fermentati TaxID=4955 RepID=A0A1G4MBM6_LACFM|nr:LAFE_0D08702g1_1 [Lachancea fermentati]